MINQRSSRETIICVLCRIGHHLEKIKRKAIQAGYQDNTIIVSGVEMCHAHYAVHYVMRIMRIMRIMQNPCNLYNTPVINKNHNISISINPTDIKHISSESSRWVESNGSLFVKIQSLDREIIDLKVLFALLRENHVIWYG